MPTELQRETSRINGSKSRGPVTARGKLNSSRNSLVHGAFTKAILVEDESLDRFYNMFKALQEELQPATPAEKALVHKMFTAQWRQMRLRNLAKEPAARDRFTAADAATFRSHVDAFLRAREMRFVSQFARALTSYRKMQKPSTNPLSD